MGRLFWKSRPAAQYQTKADRCATCAVARPIAYAIVRGRPRMCHPAWLGGFSRQRSTHGRSGRSCVGSIGNEMHARRPMRAVRPGERRARPGPAQGLQYRTVRACSAPVSVGLPASAPRWTHDRASEAARCDAMGLASGLRCSCESYDCNSEGSRRCVRWTDHR